LRLVALAVAQRVQRALVRLRHARRGRLRRLRPLARVLRGHVDVDGGEHRGVAHAHTRANAAATACGHDQPRMTAPIAAARRGRGEGGEAF
jgi:hypothetical protein